MLDNGTRKAPPTPPMQVPMQSSLLIRWFGVAVALGGLCGGAFAQTSAQPRLDTITLSAGMQNIRAEVARTPQQMMVGMMFRSEMGTHEGMLFAYDYPSIQCFWMKNTLLPLSIAFIADDGSIVNIADMAPRSEQSHCSQRPVRLVLEMNQGWFAKRGVKTGSRLTGTPFNAAK